MIDKADKIIAISHSTKKDLCEIYNIPSEKVEVIHLSTSLDKYLPQSFQYENELDFDYILYTGVRDGYKNFNNFIKAVAPILHNFKDLKVICTGSKFNLNELQLFSELKISERVLYKSANNEKLAALYKNAHLFVFPSLYEGFGIPVLEAFACKCPIAMSNCSSLPEIGGDAAKYFNPKNIESISQAILSILTNSKLRLDLIEKGELQIKNFSLKQMTQQTISCYKSVIQ